MNAIEEDFFTKVTVNSGGFLLSFSNPM
jgi:hypothetical protein